MPGSRAASINLPGARCALERFQIAARQRFLGRKASRKSHPRRCGKFAGTECAPDDDQVTRCYLIPAISFRNSPILLT
jgi:hypothetical protein